MKTRLGPEHPFHISPQDALRHPIASITKASARRQALQRSALILSTIQQRGTLLLSHREREFDTKLLHEALQVTPAQAEAFQVLLPAMYARELIIQGNGGDKKTSLRVRKKQRNLISQTRAYASSHYSSADIQKAEALAQRFARGAVFAETVSAGDTQSVRRKVAYTVDILLSETRPISSHPRRTK